jgi:hypothetical protein
MAGESLEPLVRASCSDIGNYESRTTIHRGYSERRSGCLVSSYDFSELALARSCFIDAGLERPGRHAESPAKLEGRFRDEALTTATQAATIILDGLRANHWRILVGPDAHRIDEMVRQSPERAYDIAFFDEFARAAGWTDRLSIENPELRPPS